MPELQELILVTAVILLVMAPVHASFLQCWADRARNGQQGFPTGRSNCDSCGKTLGARDLVPVLSWIWNRGRSRCCDTALHPTLFYSEVFILAIALWGAVTVPPSLVISTVILATGLQAVVLLTGPSPRPAGGFAGLLAVLGLTTIALFFPDRLVLHAGATLLALFIWIAARRQDTITPDALLLLMPAGAFTGFVGLALVGFLAIPIAMIFRWVKPMLYPEAFQRHVMPAEAVVFGLAAGLWLVWLYGPLHWF